MTTLIPSFSSCITRMTSGEKRLAQVLESKLENDYLCWYDVPIGKSARYPDFILLHPRRGLLILEVKDWKLDNIKSITKSNVTLITSNGLVNALNPMEQARQYAYTIVNVLRHDHQLVFNSGRMKGKLLFPWTYGVVLANIKRRQFENTDLGDVFDKQRIICQDEINESVDPETFQKRLWNMFTVGGYGNMSLPQVDRVRWHMFPEIRISAEERKLLDKTEISHVELPEIMQVLDLQQEQLARSLGEGHRVIHGVAGSGKTLILGYRAEYLAAVCVKPILILCYNKVLARCLEHWIRDRGIEEKVNVHTFHAWCFRQLATYNVGFPTGGPRREGYWDDVVDKVIRGVDRKLIPSGQYEAVLIDEGHDFRPEWLKLVVQLVDPSTNSLLVLYDDIQSIYHTGERRNFSFKSVGIQAQGRTTILRVNYRNTQEIFDFAGQFSKYLLTTNISVEEGMPRLAPIVAGCHGPKPQLVKLPELKDEAEYIAKQFKTAYKNGVQWKDMAVLYRQWSPVGREIKKIFTKARIPVTIHKKIEFGDNQDSVKLVTFHSSKGLEFPIVAIPGIKTKTGEKMDEEEARLMYIAITRATKELILTGYP